MPTPPTIETKIRNHSTKCTRSPHRAGFPFAEYERIVGNSRFCIVTIPIERKPPSYARDDLSDLDIRHFFAKFSRRKGALPGLVPRPSKII